MSVSSSKISVTRTMEITVLANTCDVQYKETTKYTTCRVALDIQRLPWRQAAQCSPLFQFATSRGPRQLDRWVAVLIEFSLTMLKEGDENISTIDTCYVKIKTFICWMAKIISHTRRREVTICHKKWCPCISAYNIKRSNLCSFNCYSKEQHFARKDICSFFIPVTRHALLP